MPARVHARTVQCRRTARRERAWQPGLSPRASAPDLPGSAPDLPGGLDDQAELRDLLLVGHEVALDRGGEAALRRQAELLQRHEVARLLDPPLEVVLTLELTPLGRDQAQHH